MIRTVELSANKQLELLSKLAHERDEALETIKQRDKEIKALKHMLDRLDREGEGKMRYVIINGVSLLLKDNDFIVQINIPTPKRAKLPSGWEIKGGRVEHE